MAHEAGAHGAVVDGHGHALGLQRIPHHHN